MGKEVRETPPIKNGLVPKVSACPKVYRVHDKQVASAVNDILLLCFWMDKNVSWMWTDMRVLSTAWPNANVWCDSEEHCHHPANQPCGCAVESSIVSAAGRTGSSVVWPRVESLVSNLEHQAGHQGDAAERFVKLRGVAGNSSNLAESRTRHVKSTFRPFSPEKA